MSRATDAEEVITTLQLHPDWIEDCLRCNDWDGLPIDETSREWPCGCAADLSVELD